jgi:Uma2 family endonuclease
MIAQPGPTMTLEEWAALDEDVEGELVDGVLVEDEVTTYAHDFTVMWIGHALLAWAGRKAWVAASEVKFGVGPRTGRKPDATVYLAGRKPPAEGLVRTPPDIAVEIVSGDRRDQHRDRVTKYAEYARFGIRWYWLIDPQLRLFEIHELLDGRYVRVAAATDGPIDPVPGCPGLVLDVPDLWSRLDDLESDAEGVSREAGPPK